MHMGVCVPLVCDGYDWGENAANRKLWTEIIPAHAVGVRHKGDAVVVPIPLVANLSAEGNRYVGQRQPGIGV